MIIFSFKDTDELAKKVAHQLKAEFSTLQQKNFPDGESYVRLEKSVAHKTVVLIASFAHEPNQKIIESLLVAGAAKDSGAKKVILLATYLPYMRQDKQFNSGETIAAQHIIRTLSKNFEEIFAIDPHLHRISNLQKIAKNAHNITTNEIVLNFIKKNFSEDFEIVGPDEESRKWGPKIARQLGIKSVVLKKTRLSSVKVKIKSKPLGKNVLIVDDIISTGHTVFETIKIAKKQGAKKITILGIHAVFTKETGEKISRFGKLITTNTIQNNYSKIDVAPLIARTLNSYK